METFHLKNPTDLSFNIHQPLYRLFPIPYVMIYYRVYEKLYLVFAKQQFTLSQNIYHLCYNFLQSGRDLWSTMPRITHYIYIKSIATSIQDILATHGLLLSSQVVTKGVPCRTIYLSLSHTHIYINSIAYKNCVYNSHTLFRIIGSHQEGGHWLAYVSKFM